MTLEDLIARAQAWLDQDPDPETRDELRGLIEASDEQALRDRIDSRLEFGTAGLRGELGAGPNRMNRVLVAQAASGIAAYLLANRATYLDGHGELSVVIGFDGRKNSDIFASDSAEIFAAAGIRTMLFDDVVPTPVVAFSGKNLGTSAAIVVTASHNPPRDNGYKVYLGGPNGGSQIVTPADLEISDHIHQIASTMTFDSIAKSSDFTVVGDELRNAYIEATAKLAPDMARLGATSDVIDGFGDAAETVDARQIKAVYTAMHGVGWHVVSPLFEAIGAPAPITVAEQLYPDALFSTVAFPNPEEPGAMDLSFAKAQATDADIIIANDPDADRLAIAIPDETSPAGYRRLTGDELGLILGDEMARRAKAQGVTGALACSIVSSSALSKVAEHYGLSFRETLTGFKWISKVPNLIFGYEEALGYCVDPQNVPDKDGISAAVVIAELTARLASQGLTLADHLANLGARYGYFANGQISIRVTDLTLIKTLMARLRNEPPTIIDGVDAHFTDLAIGSAELAATDGLRFDLSDGRRVIVRPSGTEPKLKCYLQATGNTALEASTGLASLDAAMRKILAS